MGDHFEIKFVVKYCKYNLSLQNKLSSNLREFLWFTTLHYYYYMYQNTWMYFHEENLLLELSGLKA